MLLAIYNQIHIPIAKTFAVGFFGTIVNACPIRDIGGFGHILFLLFATITQFMWHVFRQFSFRIRMDVIINGLGAYMNALFRKHSAYLAGRQILILYHLFHTPPQRLVFAVIA